MARLPLTQSQRWILGGIVAVGAFGIAAMVIVSSNRDEVAGPTTTAPTADTTTTTTTSPTTTSFEVVVDPYDVAFPSPTSSQRFEEPQTAARAFATSVLGFTTVQLDEFVPEGPDEGSVTIRARPSADGYGELDPSARNVPPPVDTRVRLRRSGDETWFVLGSDTAEIVVEIPAPGSSLATPFETRGEAFAFEGTVEVIVRAQENLGELGAGVVNGSQAAPPAPFSGQITFSSPPETLPGVLVYRVLSPDDGHVEYATSFPVRLVRVAG